MKKDTKKNSSLSFPTLKELLEAGVHFGHETKRWNPAYRDFIFEKRGEFHVIDLEKTLESLKKATEAIKEIASKKEILFVGTKRQARDIVREEAIRCGAHFITNRWVGGLLTNFEVIHKGIRKLREIEEKLSGDLKDYTPQDLSRFRREWGRLDRLFGGVKYLDELPGAIFLIDARYEYITVKEAKVAKIPVFAVVDSNTDPKMVDYPIPGNDDAIKSIQLFSKVFATAVIAGNLGKGVKHVFADFSRVGVEEVVDQGSIKSKKLVRKIKQEKKVEEENEKKEKSSTSKKKNDTKKRIKRKK